MLQLSLPAPFPPPRANPLSFISSGKRNGKVWEGRAENFDAAVDMAGSLAKANATAQLGEYEGPHPSITSLSLHDPNRGWRPA